MEIRRSSPHRTKAGTTLADCGILPPTGESLDGSPLALIRLPYAFTQDRLLRSEEFAEEAQKMDLATSLEELEELRRLGLLVPLFRIDDQHSDQHILNVPTTDQSELASYARAGRVRDPATDEDPHANPIDRAHYATDGRRYWDGYYFTRWQVLEFRQAQADFRSRHPGSDLDQLRMRARQRRRESILLSALAPRHLPGIWGQVSIPVGSDPGAIRAANLRITDESRIRLAEAKPSELLGRAEVLLSGAHLHDPLIGWWPLVRHSDYRGWEKLSGAALYALWQRIAAEILLRAHQHLADAHLVDPLPAETEGQFWKPLYDRISAQEADGLDQALGNLGLSPYPRVLLVVEGETELVHVSQLLEEFGVGRPNLVRVLNLQGSNKSPRELARYVTTPRLAPVKFGHRFLAATPTALFVAMDPENLWESEAQRAGERTKIQDAIRQEVEAQGATISQQELDVLVHVFTWGEDKYELANFNDDQLVEALTQLAGDNGAPSARSVQWREKAREELQKARAEHRDIKIALRRLNIPIRKTQLARLLLPCLLDELAEGKNWQPPVVEMVREVRELVQQLSGSSYALNERPAEVTKTDATP